MNLVREKSVKSQGISFQTKSGHPALGSKKVQPRGNLFYIGLYREDKKKSSLKQQSLEP